MSGHASQSTSPPRAGSELWTSARAVTAIVGVLIAVKLAVASQTDLIRDEAYYALWSFYPTQAGYYDHPPAVVWFIEAGRMFFGDSPFAFRLFAILATGLSAAAVYRSAMLLFEDRTVAGYSVLWFVLSLGTAIELFLITPDAPSTLFWTLAIWAAAELYRSRNANWWLAFGLFAGLGLASKYTGFFLGAGIVLWVLAYRENRAWLRSWQFHAGGIVALLIFAPVLHWNAVNDFRSLSFQWSRTGVASPSLERALQLFPDNIGLQVLMLGPGLFFYLGAASFLFARRIGNPAAGLLVTTAAPMLVFFAYHGLHSRVQGNWTLPLFGQLSILGAWAAVTWLPASRRASRLLAIFRQLLAPVSAAIIALVYAQAVFGLAPFRTDKQIDDMAGWSETVARVAEIAREAGTDTVLGDDYGITGWLASYSRFDKHNLRVLPGREFFRYGFMPLPDPATLERPLLYAVRSGVDRDIPAICGNDGSPEPVHASVIRNGPAGRPVDRFDIFALDDLPGRCPPSATR
ncbi:MAG: hypothetical protein CL534_15605 [Ahrensia sp.]|nr:hypothetical protein [Ahrensia sp.]